MKHSNLLYLEDKYAIIHRRENLFSIAIGKFIDDNKFQVHHQAILKPANRDVAIYKSGWMHTKGITRIISIEDAKTLIEYLENNKNIKLSTI